MTGNAIGALCAAAVLSACTDLSGAARDARQAASLEGQRQYGEAVPARQRVVDQIEAREGPDSPLLAVALSNLAGDQLYLSQTGRMFEHKDTHEGFAAAASNAQRALGIYERAYGASDPRAAGSLRQLGVIARFQDQPQDAGRLFGRALALVETAYGPADPRVADILWEIAELDESTMHFAEEESVLRRELAIRERSASPDSLRVAQSLEHLELFEVNRLGRYDLAEQYAERTLAIREKILPPADSAIGESLLGLAVIYQRQNRPAEAVPLLARAIEIKGKTFGTDSKEVAIALGQLAGVYRALDRGADERATLLRILDIDRRVFGDQDPDVAFAMTAIGDLDRFEGHLDAAAAVLGEALEIAGRERPGRSASTAGVQLALAKLYLAEHRYRDAELAAAQARDFYAIGSASAFPDLIVAHAILAKALRGEERAADALIESNAAVGGLRERTRAQYASRSSGALSERRGARDMFLDYVEMASTVARDDPERRQTLEADSYTVAQLAQASSTAEAIAGMAARFAAADDALAAAIRQRQDAAARWRQVDGLLVQAAAAPPPQRDAAHENSLRAELMALDQELDAIDRRIATGYPKYAEIANPEPVSPAATQKLLRPGEALLAYMVGERETFVWALTTSRTLMFRAPIGREELNRAVAGLRHALDPSQLDIATAFDIPPFDVNAAWRLYQAIFAPAEAVLDGAHMVFIVPDAGLQSLPFGVLVTAKPPPIREFADYRSVNWLARRYATTVLPSVSSLGVLRTFTSSSPGTRPFLGIGDPTLGGGPGAARGVPRVVLFRGGTADVDSVRSLPELPETADELRAIGEQLGAAPTDLVLRDGARKPAVMKLEFAGYRVVAFATHGLVAGDINGLAEPALVLTPPPLQAGPDDDGLLKASDVSQLVFNADWVVLSACNTAAGDGAPAAEGRAGLAKAFFFAGSRALLVSHWPVFSDATVKLTTRTFAELVKTPTLPRAVALQRASAALREDRSETYFAHPMLWAPFVVVGEGGAP